MYWGRLLTREQRGPCWFKRVRHSTTGQVFKDSIQIESVQSLYSYIRVFIFVEVVDDTR